MDSTALITSILIMWAWHTLGVITGVPSGTGGYHTTGEVMVQLADLNLAGFFPIGTYSTVHKCGNEINLNFLVSAEAMVYAINDINKRTDLLPNITLGYVIMNDCKKESTAIGHALHLNPAFARNTSCLDDFQFYDVVGIVGGITSDISIVIAQMSNVFKIPQVSPTSTNDALSDEVRFPYFLRVMPPDKHQVEAMLQLISYFNWTFITTINVDNSYGRNAIYQLKSRASQKGICLAFSLEVSSLTTTMEYEHIADSLLKSRARVVVVFASTVNVQNLLRILDKKGAYGEFIWIFSDSYPVSSPSNIQFEKVLRNAIFVEISHENDPLVKAYIENISPMSRPNNKWLKQYWMEYYSCSWNANISNATSCLAYPRLTAKAASNLQSFVIDSVYAIAHGLHTYLFDICRTEMVVKGAVLRNCISGPELYKYIKRVSFRRAHNVIQFDAKGDGIGTYDFIHFAGKNNEMDGWYYKLANWSIGEQSITLTRPVVQWIKTTNDKQTELSLDVPESVCSKPCSPRQFIIPKELRCCWECRNCRSNEIVTENATGCLECPEYTWPDQKTFDKCVNIQPYYIHWGDGLSILIILFAIIGLIATSTIAGIFHKNQDKRLVKASGRELNSIIFAGTIGAYSTVFFLLAKPSSVTCQLGRAGINIVFSVEYAALFAKTNRIFRIFHAGRRGTKRPSFISSMAQLALSLSLIGMQVRI